MGKDKKTIAKRIGTYLAAIILAGTAGYKMKSLPEKIPLTTDLEFVGSHEQDFVNHWLATLNQGNLNEPGFEDSLRSLSTQALDTIKHKKIKVEADTIEDIQFTSTAFVKARQAIEELRKESTKHEGGASNDKALRDAIYSVHQTAEHLHMVLERDKLTPQIFTFASTKEQVEWLINHHEEIQIPENASSSQPQHYYSMLLSKAVSKLGLVHRDFF